MHRCSVADYRYRMQTIQRQATIPRETMGSRMKRSREAVGISPKQMASVLDVSQSMISRWESGKADVRRMVLLSYALICNVPIAWLEGESGAADDEWLEGFRIWTRRDNRAGVTRQYALVA